MGYTKSKSQHKSKRNKNILYQYFILLFFIGVLYHIYIESSYIGKDYRYNIFVFWIPTLLGFFIILKYDILGIDFKKFYSSLKNEKRFLVKILLFLTMNLNLFLFSIIMFWIPSNIIWDVLNKIEARKNNIEVISIPVEEFTKSKYSNKIYFKFKNRTESIKVSSKTINLYINKKPNNYTVEIGVKKGIWKHYIIDHWNIKLK